MALGFNENHIIFLPHVSAVVHRLAWIYFANSDNLVVQCQIQAVFLIQFNSIGHLLKCLMECQALWKALYSCFSARPLLCTVSFLLLRGSHPLPDQLPGEHTGPPSHARQCLFHLALVGSTHAHSLTVGRSTVVGHIPTYHTCSFMCTSHIDMTVHNPAFLQVR